MTVRKSLVIISAAALTFTAMPVLAQTNNSESEGATKEETAKDKLVCKSFLNTGSRLNRTKVCKTAYDWQKDREYNAKAMSDAKSRGSLDKSGG